MLSYGKKKQPTVSRTPLLLRSIDSFFGRDTPYLPDLRPGFPKPPLKNSSVASTASSWSAPLVEFASARLSALSVPVFSERSLRESVSWRRNHAALTPTDAKPPRSPSMIHKKKDTLDGPFSTEVETNTHGQVHIHTSISETSKSEAGQRATPKSKAGPCRCTNNINLHTQIRNCPTEVAKDITHLPTRTCMATEKA